MPNKQRKIEAFNSIFVALTIYKEDAFTATPIVTERRRRKNRRKNLLHPGFISSE